MPSYYIYAVLHRFFALPDAGALGELTIILLSSLGAREPWDGAPTFIIGSLTFTFIKAKSHLYKYKGDLYFKYVKMI